MKKKDYICFAVFAAISIIGIFVGGFTGGALFGAFFNLLITVSVGKYLAAKVQEKQDQNVQDLINKISDLKHSNHDSRTEDTQID